MDNGKEEIPVGHVSSTEMDSKSRTQSWIMRKGPFRPREMHIEPAFYTPSLITQLILY